ncbi:hypothetical protein L596_017201 [Steinernema carpocapsae]|uniref:Uncharacterized protein n=1 Tax=Steinernema carpocapsae TaxID=34508 RepID=A0A4U5N0X3_STECR|nr:hypothetical protein L596_017201 [Steinernema carpocapsae]
MPYVAGAAPKDRKPRRITERRLLLVKPCRVISRDASLLVAFYDRCVFTDWNRFRKAVFELSHVSKRHQANCNSAILIVCKPLIQSSAL